MDHVYSKTKMKAGTIITIDENTQQYLVEVCVDMSFFELEGYRLKLRSL